MSPTDWHSQQRQETVSVVLRFITKTGQAIAVADGTEEPHPETGELREKLYFLPRSVIAIEGADVSDDDALDALRGGTIEVTASESLLKKKGLL